jgi:hypothetical protein
MTEDIGVIQYEEVRTALESAPDLMRDEFFRIKARVVEGNFDEIPFLCDRAVSGIEQTTPVVVQRDIEGGEAMTRKRHKPGEYVETHWGGKKADFELVYGWVDEETFDEVVKQGREAIGGDADHIPTLGPARHTYCRIIPEPSGENAFVYYFPNDPGRGAFKATVAFRDCRNIRELERAKREADPLPKINP